MDTKNDDKINFRPGHNNFNNTNSIARPNICPDKSCRTIMSLYDKEKFDQGESFSCWGRLTREQNYGPNSTHSYCICSTYKGLNRFFINGADAISNMSGLNEVIRDGKRNLSCNECGQINNMMLGINIIQYEDGSNLCAMCAVRMHKTIWSEKDKKWRYNNKQL